MFGVGSGGIFPFENDFVSLFYDYLVSAVCAYTTWDRNNDSESEQTVTFDVPPSSRPHEEEAALVRVRRGRTYGADCVSPAPAGPVV